MDKEEQAKACSWTDFAPARPPLKKIEIRKTKQKIEKQKQNNDNSNNNSSYPTVVMVTMAHQAPSRTPWKKDVGNWSEFILRSFKAGITQNKSANFTIMRSS